MRLRSKSSAKRVFPVSFKIWKHSAFNSFLTDVFIFLEALRLQTPFLESILHICDWALSCVILGISYPYLVLLNVLQRISKWHTNIRPRPRPRPSPFAEQLERWADFGWDNTKHSRIWTTDGNILYKRAFMWDRSHCAGGAVLFGGGYSERLLATPLALHRQR